MGSPINRKRTTLRWVMVGTMAARRASQRGRLNAADARYFGSAATAASTSFAC